MQPTPTNASLLYRQGLSGGEIAERLGVPYWKAYYLLGKTDTQMRSNTENSRRYNVNHDAFSEITDQDTAYWLGLMFADGYVTSGKQKCVGISLHRKDRDHLLKFRDFLEADYQVHDYAQDTEYGYTEFSRLIVTSPKMNADLIKAGCFEQKTKILEPPDLSEDLIPHFVRGFSDGDGSITFTSGAWTWKSLGTRKIVDWLDDVIPYNCCVYRDSRSDFIYCIESWSDTIRWMYKDAQTYLERKHVKAQHTL